MFVGTFSGTAEPVDKLSSNFQAEKPQAQNRTSVHQQPQQQQQPALISHFQFLVLCLLTVPVALGFCCCCALDHPICSTQYRHLPEVSVPLS
jgi:hypothetical protein